ncbi:F-box-like protein [Ceratobasidium sp. AG-Ba]|nr:F-box-like protein [Ceratobasidium sp. AG-Ba]
MSTIHYNTSFEQWKSARAKLVQATEEFMSASASFCAEITSCSQSPRFGAVIDIGESDLASINSGGTNLEKHMLALRRARNNLPNLVAFNRFPQEIKSFIFELACASCEQNNHTRLNEPDQACASPLVLAAVCSAWRLLATNTPYIWSNIDVVIGGWSGYEASQLWVERSQGGPLFLTISEHSKTTANTDLTQDRVNEICRFLRPFMSQTRSLKLKLGFYAHRLNGTIMRCWGSRNVSTAGNELHVIEVRGQGRMSPSLGLLAQTSNPNNSLQHVTSLTLRGCRFPMEAITMPEKLAELHLEDIDRNRGFDSQHLAALSRCPNLRSLAYINCHMRITHHDILVTLKKLQTLRLESSKTSDELRHVLEMLNIESDGLVMSLTLSDDARFTSTAHSFFGRTNVKRLYARNAGDHASLKSLLCSIPSLKELTVDLSCICGEAFDQFRTRNIENGDRAWWPGLQKLYLNSCWVDANCVQYTARLHTSLKRVYLFDPKNDNSTKWTDAQIKNIGKALKEGYGTTVHHHANPLTHGVSL